jgi:serine protease Do
MAGEVIGVNTLIYSNNSGGSVGIGFAIPATMAKNVTAQIREYGKPRRGWLGVRIQTVNEELAEGLRLPQARGALVANVTPDGPAEKAGIKQGDVILKFDGKDVTTMRGLPRLVAQTPIGKDVDVEILRKGQRQNMKVAVGRLSEDEEPKTPAKGPRGRDKQSRGKDSAPKDKDSGAKPGGRSALIGLVLAPLTEELRAKHKLGKDTKGVIVLEVDPASPAAEKGVKAGDVIVEAAQDAVTSIDDVNKSVDKVRKAGRKAVLLRLEDAKGDLRFVAVPVE